jgi:flavin reductase (DIM6/NTAB) family NADH-FMN oxidoreductase RutF
MPDSNDAPTVDPREFRNVMGRFATGVAILSFVRDGRPAGITVNSFLSISLDPPLVLVSLAKGSSFTTCVRRGDRYGVSFLSEGQEQLSAHFAGRPVEGMAVEYTHQRDTPLIDGSLAHVVARVVDIHPAGDHSLFIAQVEYLWQGAEAKPLIFYSGKYKQIHAHEPDVYWGAVEGAVEGFERFE